MYAEETNLGYYNERESCCKYGFKTTYRVKRGQSYHFSIFLVQWTKPRNGICLRLDRKSASLPLDSIDKEARAAVELEESPFIVHPVLNPYFIDFS